MDLTTALSIIREFGFPVFVAIWFMLRMEKRIERLAELIGSLIQANTALAKAIDSLRSGTGPVPILKEGERK